MHRKLKNRISLILLALFISMKMLGLHVFVHDGDQEHIIHCKLCEHAMMGNHYQPALFAETQEFQSITLQVMVKTQILNPYAFTFWDTFIANPLFPMPPPALA